MRRSTLRPRSPRLRALGSAHTSNAPHRDSMPPRTTPQRNSRHSPALFASASSRTRRRRCTRVAAFATHAAILVSSILVFSPAMMAPAAAQSVSRLDTRSRAAAMSANQHTFDARATAPDSLFDFNSQPRPASDHTLPAASFSHPPHSFDDVDDRLPPEPHPSAPLHRQYPRQFDDESALFGERDVSTTLSPHEYNAATSATQSAHRYSLPSSYPSSIASSWSRPERSVWFQQKAIIITSIFLAIFIVLFIGAAVFLRERKFDDELAGLDDEEALARIEERMTMGRFSDPTEKPAGGGGSRLKRRLRLGRKRSEKDSVDPDSTDPSTGSSSALRRKRFLVSRWTRTRDSNDTVRSSNDAASIRSGRSARRVALGDPTAQQTVEVVYDNTDANAASSHTATSARDANSADDSHASDSRTNRPRSPPPPHPDSAQLDGDTATSPTSGASARSPRRAVLDDTDFQAADAAETHDDDLRHMPPAYISSGSAALPSSSYDGGALAAALARGDAKHGIPPPAERDTSVPPEVFTAVLAESSGAAREQEAEAGPTAAHIATDDKALLGALSAAASMPSAPATSEATAPAYGFAGGSSSGAVILPPTAPVLEADAEGFELPPDEAQDAMGGGKGKAKQTPLATSSLLPAPPAAVQTAFSPFDQPYRSTAPPGAQLPSSPPMARIGAGSDSGGGMSSRKSEKQKEAEEEQLAQLVASRPDVPRYERRQSSANGASAPALEEGAVEGVEEDARGLPAYEQQRRASQPGTRRQMQLTPTAPSAPSAPSPSADGLDE
ncbi:uncharacterized protein PAN0_017d5505 [Moesziomyces antarcticus]|uniref:Uncharacterized protein n=2 Tax=Pseudozyma antarctica TaxID=84753 RepID=A0A081CKT2_PSEA2|nr:uncharacterized protein PAN0_017d5505 [Moesziomyces antarcticus]GAK67278.1 conserved hypothetical protein [Moesziomyces antarcticus]